MRVMISRVATRSHRGVAACHGVTIKVFRVLSRTVIQKVNLDTRSVWVASALCMLPCIPIE